MYVIIIIIITILIIINGDNYIMRSLGFFTPYPILCGW